MKNPNILKVFKTIFCNHRNLTFSFVFEMDARNFIKREVQIRKPARYITMLVK